MLIANPISDHVFKWLMADKRIAKFFLETMLNETIMEVEVKPQELPYYKTMDDKSLDSVLSVIRLDFVATIKTSNGEYKKVHIEIQKARNNIDVMPFRNYLAEQYKSEDEVETAQGKKKVALPIVTIYMLGFKLSEIPTPVLYVQRLYVDQITQTLMFAKDDFAEKLTHDCYIVQIPRIEGKANIKLEQLLSFFEKTNFVDDSRMYINYPYTIEGDEMKVMAEGLHFAGTDPERQKYLATEKEALRVHNLDLEGFLETRLELEKTIEQKERTIEEKDKTIEENKIALEAALKMIEELKKGK